MTFSYNPSELSLELNKIRLHLGDTVSSDYFLEDEEIASIQADYSTSFRRIAACCRLICSKLARKVDYRLSLLSEKNSDVYKRYMEMAQRYEASGSASYLWAGSVKVSLKEGVESDTDLVTPKIKKGIHDHPRGATVGDND